MSARGGTTAAPLQRAGSVEVRGARVRLLPGALGRSHASGVQRGKSRRARDRRRVANGQDEGEQLRRPARRPCVGPMWAEISSFFSSTLLWLHRLGNPAQAGTTKKDQPVHGGL